MYDFLRGRLVELDSGRLVLEVNGVGFDVITAVQTGESFVSAGKEVLVYTHLHAKDDGFALYGFARRQERELFRLLIKVSGVGPRLAMQILAGIKPEDLVQAMADEDWKRLTLIPGIGPKTARRLLIQLKEELTDQELLYAPSGGAPSDPVLSQAYQALQNLGVPTDSIRTALKGLSPADGLEEIVRKALAKLTP